jgi:hypothetical protein
VADDLAAIDGDQGTFARMNHGTFGGTTTLRVTAQSGVVYPGGKFAGAVVKVPAEVPGPSVTVTTYLDGVVQDSGAAIQDRVDGINADGIYYEIYTTQPFDAVEIALTRGTGVVDVETRVYEFCAE